MTLKTSKTAPHRSNVTLNDRLEATGGRPAGFDYLRIILATGVIFFHSMNLTVHQQGVFGELEHIFRPFYPFILPMFFSLSGFLVAGSLERSKTLISFLGLRAIRIIPALMVETILCAIVIGLLFTTLPYKVYFTSSGFAHYFLNIVGDIHFYLPGVFQSNIVHYVNLQLWTVPWELRCYLAIAVLTLIGFGKRKALLLGAVILLNIVIFVHHLFSGHIAGTFNEFVPGVILVECFLFGICVYSFREKIVWNGWIALVCFAIVLFLTTSRHGPWGTHLLALPSAYLTVYLGLLEPKKLVIISSGDYSYGIYLYGYPVQQSVVTLCGHYLMPWYMNFIISFPIAALLAVGSWHLVEKHASKLRPRLFGFEKRVLAMRSTLKSMAGIAASE